MPPVSDFNEGRNNEEYRPIVESSMNNDRNVLNLLYGYTIALLGVLSLTPSALLILLISDSGVEDWTILFFQNLFAGSVFLLYTIAVAESIGDFFTKFVNIGPLGLLASILLATEDIAFILAVLYANVANVYIILVCNPLVAAVLSNIFMGETLPWRTIITIVVCATAIGVAVGITLSDDFSSAWFGNTMAVVSTVCFAGYMVTIRAAQKRNRSKGGPEIDVYSVLVVGYFIAVLCTVAAGGTNHISEVADVDYAYLLALGGGISVVSMTCLSAAAKYISATEVGIYLLGEIILGPLWVYLAGLESIEWYAIYCGVVVVVALLTNSLLALHEEHQGQQDHMKYNQLSTNEEDGAGGEGVDGGGGGGGETESKGAGKGTGDGGKGRKAKTGTGADNRSI